MLAKASRMRSRNRSRNQKKNRSNCFPGKAAREINIARPFFLCASYSARPLHASRRSRGPLLVLCYTRPMPSESKKLFLVDAMAHVYRAFFAPMPQRLTGPNGAPTNVPFLFGNILKRLIKDYEPKYIGVVFDPPGA